MLERLEDIAWQTLADAQGEASSIPESIHALVDASPSVREAALDHLWLGLCHRRTALVEASAHAVPFLVELSGTRGGHDRAGVLELLQAMAELSRPRDEQAEHARHATHEVLCAHYDELLTLLADEHAEVRARAALTVSVLAQARPDWSRALVGYLERIIAHETDSDTRVAQLMALVQQRAHDIVRGSLSDPAFSVQLCAALALLNEPASQAQALAIVRSALEQPRASQERFGGASRYRPIAWISDVCAAGRAVATVLLPELLSCLLEGSAYAVTVDLAPLLETFFAHGAPVSPSREQALIAATIARNPRYFARTPGAAALLARHGLPTRPRPLRAYAARGPGDLLVARRVERDPAHAKLQRALAGEAPESACALDLVGDSSDELLSLLPSLGRLRQLQLKCAQPSARGFSQLASLPNLAVLTLEDMTIDRRSARSLAGCSALQYLSLCDVTLDAGALRELCNLRLEGLSLVACPIDAGDLGAVCALPALRELRLSELHLESRTLALHTCAALERLSLRAVPAHTLSLPSSLLALELAQLSLPVAAVHALFACRNLQKLELIDVPLTQEHVTELARCSALRVLHVDRVHVATLDLAAWSRFDVRLG